MILVITIIIIFLFFECIREGIIRNSYLAVKDSIFGSCLINYSNKKYIFMLILSNLIFISSIFFTSHISMYIFNLSQKYTVYTILFCSFLTIWPYFYFLILNFKKKYLIDFLYFLMYLAKIIYTYAICKVIIYQDFWWLFGFLIPYVFYILEYLFTKNAKMFRCDFSIETRYFLFRRNIRGAEALVDVNYGNLINTSSKKYNVPYEMLRKIIILEVFNRGKWYYKLIKNLMVYCFPKITKKLNLSIGIAQVKYKTILKYYKNKSFNLKDTIKPSVNIDIAAFKLKQIIDFWENNQDEIMCCKQYSHFVESLPEKELFTRYVYEKYTTGRQFSYVTYLTICAQYLNEGY